jgi:shikimate dehydrogenase|tara:strand:- start:16788 stop:17579 length:792 start_codon:yes stop_codon:yes gene_type:complete
LEGNGKKTIEIVVFLYVPESKYGLLGQSLEHSFSKDFFSDLFVEKGVSATYDLIEIESQNLLPVFFRKLFPLYSGINVTIPYKQKVMPFLDEISEEALEIGAVNTIKRLKDGRSVGYNTDAFGFHQSIKPFLNFNHHRALILGTGGAAKAVAYVLQKIGLDVFYISRAPKNKNQFAYSDINENMVNSCKLIVNCTPVGMFPEISKTIPFPFQFLSPEHLVIDLIYNPEETNFLKKSSQQGTLVLNGNSMLHQQALKSWDIWTS